MIVVMIDTEALPGHWTVMIDLSKQNMLHCAQFSLRIVYVSVVCVSRV